MTTCYEGRGALIYDGTGLGAQCAPPTPVLRAPGWGHGHSAPVFPFYSEDMGTQGGQVCLDPMGSSLVAKPERRGQLPTSVLGDRGLEEGRENIQITNTRHRCILPSVPGVSSHCRPSEEVPLLPPPTWRKPGSRGVGWWAAGKWPQRPGRVLICGRQEEAGTEVAIFSARRERNKISTSSHVTKLPVPLGEFKILFIVWGKKPL